MKKHFNSFLIALVVIAISTALYLPITYAIDTWSSAEPQYVVTSRYSGASTLTQTVTPSNSFQLLQVMLHLDTASTKTENFTLTLNSVYGDTWDVNLATQDMNNVKDLILDYSSSQRVFENGDALSLQWANSDSKTYGVLVKYDQKPSF